MEEVSKTDHLRLYIKKEGYRKEKLWTCKDNILQQIVC